MNLEELITRMRGGQPPATAPGLEDLGTEPPVPPAGTPPRMRYDAPVSAPGAVGRTVNIREARRRYNDYVIQMQENGERPLSFEEWNRQMLGDPAATVNPYRTR
jgi:hypothetical protein